MSYPCASDNRNIATCYFSEHNKNLQLASQLLIVNLTVKISNEIDMAD